MNNITTVAATLGLMAVMLTSASAQMLFEPKKLSAEQQHVVDKEPLGSKANPVRCERPEGEEAYLARLRCPSGKPPKFERFGSMGAGPYGTIMDRYIVTCKKTKHDVLMDMYHEGYVERRAVPGFTIVSPTGGHEQP